MSKTATSPTCNFVPNRFYSPPSATQRAVVAVSACLAGEKVRYDGADKLSPVYPLLNSELNLIAICPEQGAGLGVPRPPVQLVESDNRISARGRENRTLDVTTALQDFAARSLSQLSSTHPLCGYLWKSRSPSCGFNSTPIFNSAGNEINRGSGIQAAYFQHHLPHLSYCEDTALQTERSAISFVLSCRLAFDVLYAADPPLTELHRHYTFLHEHFDDRIAANLIALSAIAHKTDYLAALLAGCRHMPEEKLLGLFI